MAYGKSNGHVNLKGQGHDPNTLMAQYLLRTAGNAI